MRAYLIQEPGGVEALYEATIDLPSISNDEVLIEVKAISINPADVKVKQAEEGLQMVGGKQRPLILGWDVAGVVVDTGSAVASFRKGDRVFGMVNFPGHGKGYAEYVAAPAQHLAKIPIGISFTSAAATTLAALTAYQVLYSQVGKGDRVLIHAGSGGVGHFAVQIASFLGARVVATSSAKNREMVLSLGADEHIDYRAQPFEEVLSDIDFVFDTQGGQVLTKSLKVLRSGGRLVSIAEPHVSIEVAAIASVFGVSADTHLVKSSGADMQVLAAMLAKDQIAPVIAKTFRFSELRDAHTFVEEGRTAGKVVVTL